MKIVIDARMYGLEHTGIGRYTMHLIEHLSKIDHSNTYIILLRKKYFGSLDLPENFTQRLADYPHYSFAEQVKLLFLLYSLNADLVHFLHLNVPLLYNKAFVVTVHDLTISSVTKNATTHVYPIYFLKKWAYRFVAWHAIKGAKRIITPTYVVQKNVIEMYNVAESKVVTTYEGVDLKDVDNHRTIQPYNNLTIDLPYFLYVGNAYPHKNVENLLHAFKLFHQKNRDYSLILVTKRDRFRERLQKKVEELDLKKNVTFYENLSDNELIKLYRDAKAFIYPSLNEGFGLPGLEAMHLKTLLLASNIPVFREVFQTHALYFDPLSEASLAGRMSDVTTMSEIEKSKRINEAYEYSQLFTWEKTAQKTQNVYSSLGSRAK